MAKKNAPPMVRKAAADELKRMRAAERVQHTATGREKWPVKTSDPIIRRINTEGAVMRASTRATKVEHMTHVLAKTGKMTNAVKGLPSVIDLVNTQAAQAAANRPKGITPKKVRAKGWGRKA
jgi:hypothetical protein